MTFDISDVDEFVTDGRLQLIHLPTRHKVVWHQEYASERCYGRMLEELQTKVEASPE